MARFHYSGEEERVFPTLGLAVVPNAEFDAPEDFVFEGVAKVANPSKKAAAAVETEGE